MKKVYDKNGQEWYPFEVCFIADEGVFRSIIMATSRLHAELLLEDLKKNGAVIGEHVGVK